MDTGTLQSVSYVCGILMTICFSGGMVIQCFANYNNKCTIGYSTDFSIVAFAGFLLLQTNQTVGLVDPFSDAGRVHIIDEIAAIGFLLCSTIQLV